MTSTCDIRLGTLKQAHLDDLLRLYHDLHMADEPLPVRESIEAAWSDLLAQRGGVYGAWQGSALVSSCVLSIVPNLTRGCRPYGVVENVVTRKSHRRRGLGRQVLQHALEDAWGAGCYKVMLMTGRRDAAIIRFYEQCGFSADEKQAFLARRPP